MIGAVSRAFCVALSMVFGFILSVTMAISLLIYLVIATTPPEHY
jgi:hypothetical protein